MDQDSINNIKEARPVLRSILAFAIYLRYVDKGIGASYKAADIFLDQLEEDVNG